MAVNLILEKAIQLRSLSFERVQATRRELAGRSPMVQALIEKINIATGLWLLSREACASFKQLETCLSAHRCENAHLRDIAAKLFGNEAKDHLQTQPSRVLQRAKVH